MIAALILAGGQGSRLGGADKAFLKLAGKPLIAHVLDKLHPQMARLTRMAAPPIAISANGDASRFAPIALPILPDDIHAGAGPLAGVLAGLLWARSIGAESLVTIPVDTPFFPDDFAARLIPSPAVAIWRGRQHHLAASWPVTALPHLRRVLETPGARRVRDVLARLAARAAVFEAESDPFLNINTPDDLARAEEKAVAFLKKMPGRAASAKTFDSP